jgi:putative restriction endonuclease
MLYLEMSRDPLHGGGSWSFGNCVWAPTKKESGGHWPFWTKILDIRQGDTVIHLRGKSPNAEFVGYSIASTDGFESSSRPPEAEGWSASTKFYRADLQGFTPFHRALNLKEVFGQRKKQLEAYFDKNKSQPGRKNIFFVRQSGRLQCLNGAYLSEVDENLFNALFGVDFPLTSTSEHQLITVETGIQLVTVKGRVGQSEFSLRVKNLYSNKCCFPGCDVTDRRFLVGSHIARWTDNEILRGDISNGLCFCLFHDKAFELGLFTLDKKYRVFANNRELKSPVFKGLASAHGKIIQLSKVRPNLDALLEHWNRIDVRPM